MKNLKILITACGTPGFIPLFKQLKAIKERDIEIIGTDMDENASGRFMVDKFYQVHPASDDSFQIELFDVIFNEKPDIVIPESSLEIAKIAAMKPQIKSVRGCKLMVNNYRVIKDVEDKLSLYEKLEKADIPIPKYFTPYDLDDFEAGAFHLGYPSKKICFKPCIGKGSRGFRIIDKNKSNMDILFKERPFKPYISMDTFVEIFQDKQMLPDLLLCEYVEGTEYDCMILANDNSDALLVTVKIREESKYGLSSKGVLVDSPYHVEMCKKITKELGLKYCNGIQFKGNKVIEVNPRLSTYIYDKDFCEPYIAIKMLLGELTNDEVRSYQEKIPIGRKFIRTTDQVFYE